MKCQTYNSGNKCWVLRDCETGKIVDNQKERYNDIPVVSELSAQPAQNKLDISPEPPELDTPEPLTPPENEEPEIVGVESDSKDDEGWFEWYD